MRIRRVRDALSILFTVLMLLALAACDALAAENPPPELKIAFIGDQGLGGDAVDVLRLIRDEGAEAVLHQGDFDYENDPKAWDAQIDDVLGTQFPYFASVGNHDESKWYGAGGYQDRLEARMQRLGIPWQGDLGVASTFHFRGIFVVMTAPDVFGDGDDEYAPYLRDALAGDDSTWSVSSFHKNMAAMQVGGKSDEAGWGVYEESRRGGAVVATAHEHSYSRTHLLASFESQAIASTSQPLRLSADDPLTAADEGRSFAFVSGLGGQSIRDQERTGPWWARIYTATQGAASGALFAVFNHQGNPRLARFYFKDVEGNVVDDFLVESAVGEPPPPKPPPKPEPKPAPPPACRDGLDNDRDGQIDYPGDLGCADASDANETGRPLACRDGLDNDRDGRIDYPDDLGCADASDANENGGPPACRDGLDNDHDGQIDYPDDLGCADASDANETGRPLACRDGLDNDRDGRIDYPDDLGCADASDGNENGGPPACRDGLDNDHDGQIDYPDDLGCADASDANETGRPLACRDGLDNDRDGRIDYPDDLGCADASDGNENGGPPACRDGLDNDHDGQIDYPDDLGCADASDANETGRPLACRDGLDNDRDGRIDYPDDLGCADARDGNEMGGPA